MSKQNKKYLIKVCIRRKSITDRFPASPESVSEINFRYQQEGKLEVATEISIDGLEITLLMYFNSFDIYTDYHEELKKTTYSIEKEYLERQKEVEESFEVVGYVDYFLQNTP